MRTPNTWCVRAPGVVHAVFQNGVVRLFPGHTALTHSGAPTGRAVVQPHHKTSMQYIGSVMAVRGVVGGDTEGGCW